jgi:hypothetical protein|tara:strand:+ start:2237 stop:2638 length:402 start_codon:yes stop_codon:yes gene_type:complete
MLDKKKICFEMMIHKVETFQKINAEEFALDLFKKLGFESNYSKQLFKKEIGLPDLYVVKGEEKYFIEVKTNGDGLRTEQLEWILNNPRKKVIVFCLKQKIYKEKIKQIHLKRKEKEQKINELKTLAEEANQII